MNDPAVTERLASRPHYHFTAPANWLNDPNGLVHAGGLYHMFYQYNPAANTFGPPSWGHATSQDLISWTHREVALEPDDLGMIYSGSAVVDHENTAGFGTGAVVAVFTHHLEPGVERQSLAFSTNEGRSWTKYSGNPVLEAPPGEPDFRDPKVFWWRGEQGGHWVMLLAVGVAVWLYRSDDLLKWTLASKFEPDVGSARVWECPDLFRIAVDGTAEYRWVLAVGVDSGDLPHLYGTRYFVGQFDGLAFTENHTTVHWADHGADFYAAQSWSNMPDGRQVWIGWMNNWGYARETPTEGWRGAMSVPRELGLRATADGIRLTQQPVKELATHRKTLMDRVDLAVTPGVNPCEGLGGVALDIVCRIDLARSGASKLRLGVRVGDVEATNVVIDLAAPSISVDRFKSGRHLIHREYVGPRMAVADQNDVTDVRVLVDATSVEVFAGDGAVVITEQIFPRPASDVLELEAIGGEVILERFEVHAIQID